MIYVNKEVTIKDYTESKIGFLLKLKLKGKEKENEVSCE